MTPYTNPCNEIYRLAAGKRKSTAKITTLRKPDWSLTTDLHETLKQMLEYFVPEYVCKYLCFFGHFFDCVSLYVYSFSFNLYSCI
jgi:hypothetical protein